LGKFKTFINYPMKASEMPLSSAYLIKEIKDSPLQVNLLEMGVWTGKSIRLLHSAPFGGSLAFEIGENVVCMRPLEAALIMVEPVAESQGSSLPK
jgi:Fe2+ transport system protein FeoA